MPSKTADPTNNGTSVRAADELTPLLNAPDADPTLRQQNDSPSKGHATNGHPTGHATATATTPHHASEESNKPMPLTQILLLCYTALAEPVAYFAIFPFINEMIHLTGGVPQSKVGFWSGLIESLFSVVQMLLMIFYGRAADRIGRKPVLVFSLTGIGIATALFGMSQSVWQMVLTRCLAGVFAGSVVTVRTMISENCTKEVQGRAFSWYMFVRNMGILIGPVIGGGLANPAEQFPRIFKGSPFWEKYPYALSTYATAAVVLSAAIVSLFLKETLVRKGDGASKAEPPMTTWQVLTSPGVPMVLYIWAHTTIVSLIYTAVTPVMMYTPVKLGGFGFTDQQISLFLVDIGAGQAIWTLAAFPPLQRRYGTGTVMRWSVGPLPFFMAAWPLANELLRHDMTLAFWIAAPVGLALFSGVAMMFACCQLFINDIAPSPAVLGTLNALALTINSGVRTFAPVLGTSLFAAGIDWGFADGHAVWFVLFVLAAGLSVAMYFLPEAAEGKLKKPSPPLAGNEERDDER